MKYIENNSHTFEGDYNNCNLKYIDIIIIIVIIIIIKRGRQCKAERVIYSNYAP